MLKRIMNPLNGNSSPKDYFADPRSKIASTTMDLEQPSPYQLGVFRLLMNPSLTLTLDELNECIANFKLHYKNDGLTDFANPLKVKWNDLLAAVTESGINPDNLVLYSIHRFDTVTQTWFLTIEFCEMIGFTTPPATITEYPVQHTGFLKDVTSAGLVNHVASAGLGQIYGLYYGKDYFDHIQYSVNGTVFNPLDKNINTRATLISWYEVQKMHDENIYPGETDAKFQLCFSAITSDYDELWFSLVRFPHTIAIHSIYDNVNRLDNIHSVVVGTQFKNKAGDFQTLCPPGCSSYFWPDGLTLALQVF